MFIIYIKKTNTTDKSEVNKATLISVKWREPKHSLLINSNYSSNGRLCVCVFFLYKYINIISLMAWRQKFRTTQWSFISFYFFYALEIYSSQQSENCQKYKKKFPKFKRQYRRRHFNIGVSGTRGHPIFVFFRFVYYS